MNLCLTTGWTDEYVLSMPAKRFFSFAKLARDIEHKKKCVDFYNFALIAGIPVAKDIQQYSEKLREYFWSETLTEKEKKKSNHVFDAEDPQSASIIAAMLKSQARLRHG